MIHFSYHLICLNQTFISYEVSMVHDTPGHEHTINIKHDMIQLRKTKTIKYKFLIYSLIPLHSDQPELHTVILQSRRTVKHTFTTYVSTFNAMLQPKTKISLISHSTVRS